MASKKSAVKVATKAATPAISAAGKLIARIRAKTGATYAAIGRMLKRDSSLIRQIEKGKKRGSNLEAGLRTIDKGGTPKAPLRRKTKTGEVANTRISTPKRAVIKSKTLSELIARLEKISLNGGVVSFQMDWGSLSFERLNAHKGSKSLLDALQAGKATLYGSGGHKSRAETILASAKSYARAHSKLTDEKQLEGFLRREMKGRWDGLNAPRLKKADNLQSLTLEPSYDRPSRSRSKGR